MTAEEFRLARQELGLSARGLAELLRLGTDGGRAVRRWEAGDSPVSGPVSLVMEALMSGWRPKQ